MSLNTLPIRLGGLGRREEALTGIKQAVTIWRSWLRRGAVPTTTTWNNRCEMLPGLSTAKISATHPRRSRRSDNGPLSPAASCVQPD
jgi:hypothetical protein